MRSSPTYFRSSELMRLTTMALMLSLVGVLMVRARDPAMWRWIAPDDSNRLESAKDFDQSSSNATAIAKAAPEHAEADALADEDDEERAAALEEFQAVSDGSISIQPEEMHAYRRLLNWVDCQSLGRLKARGRAAPSLNDLMQEPAVHRGELTRLDLNICRVLKYDLHDDDSGAQRTLYELWGWQDNTQGWLYVVVTPEIPAAIELGARVDQHATFYGYFFKLQGYYPAGAKPHDRPLNAPLFVGRVAYSTPRRTVSPSNSGVDYIWIALTLVVAGYLSIRVWIWRRRNAAPVSTASTLSQQETEYWLTSAQDSTSGDPPPQFP
jgi:hypothetical protein